jgi:uncharacterized protein YbaR (Trm112 family)
MPLPDILKIIVCPACKGQLAVDDGMRNLTCEQCGLMFPVRDGIPVMLMEEAEKLGTQEIEGEGT